MVQHEALLALLGHPGVLVARGKDGAFAVGECVDFLAVHEKALLQRIAVAGETYVALDAFVRCVREDGVWRDGAPVSDGLYLRALCTGLDEVRVARERMRAGRTRRFHTQRYVGDSIHACAYCTDGSSYRL